MARTPLDRLRAVCLALPEATEKETWSTATFRVHNKMFGMYVDDHHGDGRVALWCKAPPGAQEILVGAAPQRFFVPPYVGHKGWIGVRLDVEVDWSEITELVRDSFLMTAPKRILAQLDAAAPPPALRRAAPPKARPPARRARR